MNEKCLVVATFVFFACSATAPAETITALANGSYSAELTWNTDRPATSQAEYGVDISQGYPDSTVKDDRLTTHHHVTLKNLRATTSYHYRVKSTDSAGNETVSDDYILVIPDPHAKTAMKITDVAADSIVAAGLTGDQPAPSSAPVMMSPANQDPGQSQPQAAGSPMVQKEKPVEETLIEKGALLLPPHKLQIEPSFTYTHLSANKIVVNGFSIVPILVIGEISSEKVKRDIFIPAYTMRYGLLNDLQLNVKVPYRYQFNRTMNVNNTETTDSRGGIGDIESGLFYQLAYEDGAMPGLIAGLNVKSDTGKSPYGTELGLGTGHWGITANLVGVKSADPAILFWNLGYTYNVQRDVKGFGSIKPGDTISYSLGMAFALNYQVALNFQVEQQITDSMRIDHNRVSGSFTNVVDFKTGLTYSLSKNLSLDIVSGWGLTEDSPDYILEVRVPYTF